VAALGRPAVDLAAAYGVGLQDLVLGAHDTLRSRGAEPRLQIPAERPAPSGAALADARAVAAAELEGAGDGIRVSEGRSALAACERALAGGGVPTPGELTGPFISQFLARDIQYGPYLVPQRVRAGLAGVEYLSDTTSWLNIQNGGPAAPFAIVGAASARFINDNRALSAYLRADFSPQGFFNAALMLLGFGLGALSPSNPYKTSLNQAGMATFGGGELIDLIGHASGIALKACWYQKWAVHRRLRPEAFGGWVHNAKTTTRMYPIHHELLDSSVLTAVNSKYGSYLLPMAYPEGSPAHPAYPAGHAVFAGAHKLDDRQGKVGEAQRVGLAASL